MVRATEATRTPQPSMLNDALLAGIDTLSLNQEVQFTPYNRVILPIDGFVFWTPNEPYSVSGSLHYNEEIQLSEDEVVDYATVIFSAEKQVAQFARTTNPQIHVATIGGLRCAFSSQSGFYSQAGLWHYVGHSIYPALQSQLLDAGTKIDLTRAVVSNSLPLWLSMAGYLGADPPYAALASPVTLYPAFQEAENLSPPYGVVNIEETTALQALPMRTATVPHSQLVSDRVLLSFYGLQNTECLEFQDFMLQYSADTDAMGIMSMPVIKDEKRGQEEIRALGMRKTMAVTVSYYQSYAAQVAYQLIKSAQAAFNIGQP